LYPLFVVAGSKALPLGGSAARAMGVCNTARAEFGVRRETQVILSNAFGRASQRQRPDSPASTSLVFETKKGYLLLQIHHGKTLKIR
jgi:hypothetical protein